MHFNQLASGGDESAEQLVIRKQQQILHLREDVTEALPLQARAEQAGRKADEMGW